MNYIDKLIKCFRIIMLLLVSFAVVNDLSAQTTDTKDKSYAIMNKAFGKLGETDNYAIYFEGVAQGLKKPMDIFSLPVYQIHRSGHLFMDGNKFELKLGPVKGLCDGKLMVMINDDSKSMVIDSFRPADMNKELDLKTIFGGEDYSDTKLSYEGKETVNKKECHKIKMSLNGGADYHVYYWVEVATGNILLMAEGQEQLYDVYWFRKIGKAPEGHNYSVNVPKKPLKDLYGYEVFDMRFALKE